MQQNSVDDIIRYMEQKMNNYFGNRIEGYSIYNFDDSPYARTFNMIFSLYNYFTVGLNYDRGKFGCHIVNGKWGVALNNSQERRDLERADIDLFIREIDEQVRLRIPDKYLEYYGWK